jgi:hypothetical protein
MRQRRQVEASTNHTDTTTPDASSQAMDVYNEIEPMECDEIHADERFENRDLAFITHWRLATEHFEKSFYGNKLGFVCGVCDRIWFQKDLNLLNSAMLQFLQQDEDVQQFMLSSNCWTSVKQGKVPTLSKSNVFTEANKLAAVGST